MFGVEAAFPVDRVYGCLKQVVYPIGNRMAVIDNVYQLVDVDFWINLNLKGETGLPAV